MSESDCVVQLNVNGMQMRWHVKMQVVIMMEMKMEIDDMITKHIH